jgi:transposase
MKHREYPAALKQAALERKIGQQQVDLDFFRRALRHVRERVRPSVVLGVVRSTKSSRR